MTSFEEILIKNGYIVDNDYDEYKSLEYIYNKSYFNSTQLNLILAPSFACNLSCPYCFEKIHWKTKTEPQYFEILARYAERYFKYYNHVEISLFGGEPLIFADEFIKFLSLTSFLAKRFKFTVGSSITTNGTLLAPEILEGLLQNKCEQLQITLDGNQESHNRTRTFKNGLPSFNILIEIINKVLGPKILDDSLRFILRINLYNNTAEEISDTLKCVDPQIRGKIEVLLRPVYSTEGYSCNNLNNVGDLKAFYVEAKKLGFMIMQTKHPFRSCESCGDENTQIIAPDMGVWKCINAMSVTEAKIGSISSDGVFLLDAKAVVAWYKASDCFSDVKCRNCSLLPDCFGGCILTNLKAKSRKCTPFESVGLRYLYN
ncbi:MAG: radical SAM protein [Anaerolineaceae bacterium]